MLALYLVFSVYFLDALVQFIKRHEELRVTEQLGIVIVLLLRLLCNLELVLEAVVAMNHGRPVPEIFPVHE